MLGSKNDEFFNLRDDVVLSQDEFVNRWRIRLKKAAEARNSGSVFWLWKSLKKYKTFQKYTMIFLRRSYLRHFDELSMNRPVLPNHGRVLRMNRENVSCRLMLFRADFYLPIRKT
jgi:hypothetical protein